MITNISARIAKPNTPESDTQAKIWYIVEFTDANSVRQITQAYATSPMDAIQVIRECYAKSGEFQKIIK